jgi:hypothetical protein
LISEQQAKDWISVDLKNETVLKLFSDATSLTDIPSCKLNRWIIDFYGMSLEEANDHLLPFEHVRTKVKPERDKNRDQKSKEYWWLSPRPRPEMRQELSSISEYFIVPRHSKWFIFLPGESKWLPSDSTKVVVSDDFYILGILTSNVHRTWVKAQSSTLKGDTRYTHNTCFEIFPFPQTSDPKLIEQIRSTAQELHDYRSQ